MVATVSPEQGADLTKHFVGCLQLLKVLVHYALTLVARNLSNFSAQLGHKSAANLWLISTVTQPVLLAVRSAGHLSHRVFVIWWLCIWLNGLGFVRREFELCLSGFFP
jgi:hypothetical protein